ncbi:hypothetical protein ACU4GD_04745 [Cupriavidus basilensis]
MLAVTIRTAPDAPPTDHRLCLVHKSEYEIVDNWFAAGLKGTGSKQVVCNEIFVPMHRALCMADIRGGEHPGSAANPGPLFRVPLVALGGHTLAGPALGNAQAAFEIFLETNRSRKTHSHGGEDQRFPGRADQGRPPPRRKSTQPARCCAPTQPRPWRSPVAARFLTCTRS